MSAGRRSRERRRKVNTYVSRFGAFFTFIGIWWLASLSGLVNPIFISNPAKVAEAFSERALDLEMWLQVWATASASVLALVFGSAAGFMAGVILAKSRVLRDGLNPFITLANAIPRPAIAPIIILWFGIGITSKVVVGASLVFFMMLLTTLAGMMNLSPDIELMSRSMGMSRRRMLWSIELPAAIPSVVAGLRLGAVYSVLGVVLCEMVASYSGLGRMLILDTNALNIPGAFADILFMALLAMTMDVGIGLFQRRLVWVEQNS